MVEVVVLGCSIQSVSSVEAGRYRYSLQGDDWPKELELLPVVYSTSRNPSHSRLRIR